MTEAEAMAKMLEDVFSGRLTSEAAALLRRQQGEIERLKGFYDVCERLRLDNAGHIARAEAAETLLAEGIRQVEYLHSKFGTTGSGEAFITRARAALGGPNG